MSGRVLSTSVGINREAFTGRDWAAFSGVALIWGSSFLLIAIGLESLSPFTITWMRVSFGAMALAFFPKARTRIGADHRARVIMLSFTWVAVPMTLFPIAQQYINSAVTGLLNGGTPIFTAIIATLMLRRRPRGAQMAGLVVGFFGVAIISFARGSTGSVETLGVLLVVAATMCYGLSINLAAPAQQAYGSVPVMAQMLMYATLWTTPLGVFGLTRSAFAWRPVLAVSFLGFIGTGIAFVFMATLVGRVGSTRGSTSTYVIPLVALVLGVVVLGDEVVPFEILGSVLVIGGAVLASRRETGVGPPGGR